MMFEILNVNTLRDDSRLRLVLVGEISQELDKAETIFIVELLVDGVIIVITFVHPVKIFN